MKLFYEVDANNNHLDEDFKRTFIFLGENKKVEFIMHVWFDSSQQNEFLGFQISDSAESGTLINWTRNGHAEFSVNNFTQGYSSYWQNPNVWKEADIKEVDYYIERIIEEEMESEIKNNILLILKKYRDKV